MGSKGRFASGQAVPALQQCAATLAHGEKFAASLGSLALLGKLASLDSLLAAWTAAFFCAFSTRPIGLISLICLIQTGKWLCPHDGLRNKYGRTR